ncbi:MAG: ABC transporter permease [Candidatus Hydrogenedentota bacterium]|nr:MAG: ABC transporter permease [Candidatus Hydrogenedentota bacterium]
MVKTIELIGRIFLDVIREIGGVATLLVETCYFAFVAPFRGEFPDRKNFGKQLVEEGIKSIPIVALLSFTVGLILAMQTAYNLRKLGAESYMPPLVAIATVRELGPLIASIIISGRVGAAIAAELGTMVVAEEIDALRCMALHPTRFLIVPKVGALLIMLPCLAMLADAASIFGAYAFGASALQMSAAKFRQFAFEYMVARDLWSGLLKAAVFSLLISGIACYKGITVTGGAEGVGRATTQTVVHSIFAIILVDGIFTAIFYFIFP